MFFNPNFLNSMAVIPSSLSKQLSTKVNMHFNPEGKGKLVIHFDSIEEADWLMHQS